MTTKQIILGRINRIAETHFFIKPVLVSALKKNIITEEGKKYVNGANTYFEFWISTASDKFYDMGTFIRLGTEIESALKLYYMNAKGHKNLIELRADPACQENVFQRVLPWTKNSAVDLYNSQLNIDLKKNSKLPSIQEFMLCRHLYTHSSGLINEDFVTRYKQLTGIDITSFPHIGTHYPNEDVFFFDPLAKLNQFIEDSRGFVDELP